MNKDDAVDLSDSLDVVGVGRVRRALVSLERVEMESIRLKRD